MPARLSPVLSGLRTYPFVRLTEAREAAQARGVDVIDLGIGEPRDPVPALLRQALSEAVLAEEMSPYPLAVGLPVFRAAAADWVRRRFGTAVDPDTEVIPTLGAKELIFGLAQTVGGPGSRVAVTVPGYPVAARGAAFAGCEVLEVPLDPASGWLPDLDSLDLDGIALLWLNFPGNPTAATAPLAFLEQAAERCRAAGTVLACDEAYSELWFDGDPPASGLQVGDRTGVLAVHTLSKRSSVPGYRCGFAAGDAALIAALRRFRPNAGVTPQAFVQRAGAVAYGDEAHVVEARERYRAKRDALLPALLEHGLEQAGGDATFFLWLRVPGGDGEAYARDLLARHGLVVTPGEFFGPAGAGHVRVALVPTLARCEEAAARLGSAA